MKDMMTIGDFLTILAIVCMVVVCTYLVVLIKNLNDSVKIIKKLLKDNKDNIDATLKDMPVISKNLVDATSTAKNELETVGNAINSISETVEMTAAAANSIKSGFFGKLKKTVDFVSMAGKVLINDKKRESIK
ncbi:MAG: hypothetical protein N3I35_11945 [Clostridia bacterium]|nr:hypothetical protein [Clostridia bacterium]